MGENYIWIYSIIFPGTVALVEHHPTNQDPPLQTNFATLSKIGPDFSNKKSFKIEVTKKLS